PGRSSPRRGRGPAPERDTPPPRAGPRAPSSGRSRPTTPGSSRTRPPPPGAAAPRSTRDRSRRRDASRRSGRPSLLRDGAIAQRRNVAGLPQRARASSRWRNRGRRSIPGRTTALTTTGGAREAGPMNAARSTASPYRVFDPLLPAELAREMIALCERFGSYGMYSEEGTADDLGSGLPQRYDAAINFVRSGGRFGRQEPIAVLAARTNYFRETYAYRDRVALPGIEPFWRYEGFFDAARAIHGRPIVEPAIVYANILLPGQELAVHTDVPEFRGMSRMSDPQWLLVAMHHSGLFERWRLPIVTAVAYFDECAGGEFAFYPEGASGPARTLP